MDDVKFPGEQSWAAHLQVRASSLMDGRPSVHMEPKEKAFPEFFLFFPANIARAPTCLEIEELTPHKRKKQEMIMNSHFEKMSFPSFALLRVGSDEIRGLSSRCRALCKNRPHCPIMEIGGDLYEGDGLVDWMTF
ncbi:hypothetical protein CEXT_297861 [Caerostris extrusa]|uniref:Uncharacterized protein n=1 Tax=Caerostris extrusa TaxID=172846 RepID=A0AAV4TWM7_CAEEX|nr:hypothetical protein CEXT_297861 [Caerostris extrusa]